MSENKNQDNENSQKKQLLIVLVISVIILGSIFLGYYIKNRDNKFDYLGLHWQKTQMGKLFFYSTRIPVFDKYGNPNGNYAINLRNNPKKLGRVKTDIEGGLMKFKIHHKIYFSLDPNMKKCDMNVIAVSLISSFLSGFGGLKIETAATDKDYARKNNLTYANCDNSLYNTVLIFKSGNETKITKRGDCYVLSYTNCESVKVSEKFILLIIRDYMNQIKSKIKNE